MLNLRSLCWSSAYALLLVSFAVTSVLPTAAFAGPAVQILQPRQGQIISGVIWIDVSYSTSTDAPITTLEIYVDDQLARKYNLAAPEKAGSKSFQWDFSLVAATTHAISAKAIDGEGASGSATITVVVRKVETTTTQPGARDAIPPTVNIYYPAQGAKVSGLVEIRAEARDNVGVQFVYFTIDGRLHKLIGNSPPYYDQWDTTKTTDGIHVLEAAATDAADNEARSAQVTVIVENHAMTRMATGATTLSVPPSPTLKPQPTTTQPVVVQPQPVSPPPAVTPLPKRVVTVPPPTVAEPRPQRPAIPAPPVIEPSKIIAAGGPKVTTPVSVPTFVPEQAGEQPTLAMAFSTRLGGQQSPIAFYEATDRDYTQAPRSTYPGRVLRAPEAPGVPTLTIGELRPAQPVAITRATTSHGTLAVVRETLKREPTVHSPTTTPAMPAETSSTVPAPQRQAATATGPKAVAPGAQLAVERPVIPPTVGSAKYGLIAAQKATAAERGGELTVVPCGFARVTRPGYVAPQATTAAATPVKLPSRTSTAATLARADLKAADQHISLPQLVKALPATAPRAVDLDAAIPTLRLVTKVVPGAGMVAAALPQRTSTPQEISVAPPTRKPVTTKVTEPPVLSDSQPAPVASIKSGVAMLPKAEVSSPPDKGHTTRPAIGDLAVAIARSPVKDIAIVFDGEALALRTAPETLNGIATGPLRELFEHTDGVLYWFPITKEVRAFNADTDLHLTIGNPDIDINGSTERVPLAPYIKQGRTMLPLQFVADMLDVTISYEQTTHQIVISSNEF